MHSQKPGCYERHTSCDKSNLPLAIGLVCEDAVTNLLQQRIGIALVDQSYEIIYSTC